MADAPSWARPLDAAAPDWARPLTVASSSAPYKSPDDVPTDAADALAGHAADNIPFMKQVGALIGAAKMRAAGSPVDFKENYNQLLMAEQRQLDRSKIESPVLSRVGAGAGFVGTAAALPISGAVGLAGLGGLMGLSDATAKPNATVGDVATRTLTSAALAPVLGKAVEAAAPYVSEGLGRGAEWLGGKAEDLAGWLKINSIHPNPKLAEAMADLPGGKVAVGKKLLSGGVGGLTKDSTAAQAKVAADEAGAAIVEIAKTYDAAGGAPIDLNPALAKGLNHAAKLQAEPTTRVAGERLEDLINQYAQKFQGKPVTAAEALGMKRALGSAAYKQGPAAAAGDTVAGDFGEGMGKLERAVDDALDGALGPDFASANLTSRQLYKAADAASRQGGRSSSNKVMGLLPFIAGAEGYSSHGGGGAAAGALGAMLLDKYGAQAGARTLYSPVAGGLNMLGRGLQALPGSVAGTAAAEGAGPLLGDFLSASPTPTLADRDTLERRQALAQLLQRSP